MYTIITLQLLLTLYQMPYNGEITLEEWIRSRCPSNAAKCLALRQILEVGD